jgi:hypothetical protein
VSGEDALWALGCSKGRILATWMCLLKSIIWFNLRNYSCLLFHDCERVCERVCVCVCVCV